MNIFEPSSPSGGVEQRKSPRKKVLWTRKVVYDEGKPVLDCTIRDISAMGARITLAHGRSILEKAYFSIFQTASLITLASFPNASAASD